MNMKWNDHRADAPYESDQWATTDRGWLHWVNHPHLDGGYFESSAVGNYLDYGPVGSSGPQGERVHACAYLFTHDQLTGLIHSTPTRCKWFENTVEARQWIEEQAAQLAEQAGLAQAQYQAALPMV